MHLFIDSCNTYLLILLCTRVILLWTVKWIRPTRPVFSWREKNHQCIKTKIKMSYHTEKTPWHIKKLGWDIKRAGSYFGLNGRGRSLWERDIEVETWMTEKGHPYHIFQIAKKQFVQKPQGKHKLCILEEWKVGNPISSYCFPFHLGKDRWWAQGILFLFISHWRNLSPLHARLCLPSAFLNHCLPTYFQRKIWPHFILPSSLLNCFSALYPVCESLLI